MVSLNLVESSNSRIRTTLPAGLVAIFAGATNGVGETTVRQFAKHTVAPRVYIVGRSQEAGDRITAECKALNPDGTFLFLRRDTSLMCTVDLLCDEITDREEHINLLFLAIGTLQVGMHTKEGLHYPVALTVYARNRFISNLLPLIRRAQGLRRVVSVYGATFEGKIHMDDFQAEHLNRMASQGHEASITTLALEAHHKVAPEVSFIHNFPGSVESGIARGQIGWFMRTLKTIWVLLAPLVNIPLKEAGERHVFLCTSARFAASSEDDAGGVPLEDGLPAARGTEGRVSSGVYSVSEMGESSGPKVESLLAHLRSQGLVEKVNDKLASDISKIVGLESKQQT